MGESNNPTCSVSVQFHHQTKLHKSCISCTNIKIHPSTPITVRIVACTNNGSWNYQIRGYPVCFASTSVAYPELRQKSAALL
jgi:hypothetical protein